MEATVGASDRATEKGESSLEGLHAGGTLVLLGTDRKEVDMASTSRKSGLQTGLWRAFTVRRRQGFIPCSYWVGF